MESHRVLCLNEVEIELYLALEIAGCCQLFIRPASGTGRLELLNEVHERVHGEIAECRGASLDGVHPRLQLSLEPSVTGLTGVVNIQPR